MDLSAKYSPYRNDCHSTQRCASQPTPSSAAYHFRHAPSGQDSWLYQNYISPSSAFSKVQLSSGMYSHHRAPDQSYPSPSPSVSSPGPRPHPQLDLISAPNHSLTLTMSLSNDSGGALPRPESTLGPVRNVRSRQATMNFKQNVLGRRQSISDSPKDEGSPQLHHSPLSIAHDDNGSRPQTPAFSRDSEYDSNRNRLSLGLSGLDAVPVDTPYEPATPSSLCSPYIAYSDFGFVRPTSETLLPQNPRQASPANSVASSLTSGSLRSVNHYLFTPVAPIDLAKPPARTRKHTKKRLDSNEKKKICIYHLSHQNARQEDIAEAFGIERSTVSKILKAKDRWLNVKDSVDSNSKNRPSKFPELEEVMRQFLQECIDTNTNISDSLIRIRALEVAKNLCITEDKFKASSGWIENFKHRHEIKSGKWIKGVKNVAASQTANPGLDGDSGPPAQSPRSPSNSYQLQQMDNGSTDSLVESDRFDSPVEERTEQGYHGDHGQQQQLIHDRAQSHWSGSVHHGMDRHVLEDPAIMVDPSSSHHLPLAAHPSPPDYQSPLVHHSRSDCLHPTVGHPPSASASPEAIDQGHSHHQVVVQQDVNSYLPDELVYTQTGIAAVNDMPTIADAENAINTLITFLDRSGHRILEPHERETLTTIKCALFQFASGVPFDRN